jgi:hypothetical protein
MVGRQGIHRTVQQDTASVKSWLAVGLAVSALLLVRAMPHSPLRGSSQQVRSVAVSTTSTSARGPTASVSLPTSRIETVYVRKLITQPIETIRVGQRVLGTNPNRDEVEPFEEPDPKTWRTIEVEQIKPSGKKLYATLLRPLEWIEEELDPEPTPSSWTSRSWGRKGRRGCCGSAPVRRLRLATGTSSQPLSNTSRTADY